MKAISKILILFVLLFSTLTAYSQCETYLQKANTLFAEKKYEMPNDSMLITKNANQMQQELTKKLRNVTK